MKIRVNATDPSIRRLLERHPRVELGNIATDAAIEFFHENRWRRVWMDSPDAELYGLVELVDNNPLVCADSFSTPSSEGTLMLIAFGPLMGAGILQEPPHGIVNGAVDEDSIARAASSAGWHAPVSITGEDSADTQVRAGVFYAVVSTPPDLSLIDDLYESVYGASFLVRKCDDGDWTPELVRGQPYACYRLRITPDEPNSLLTVRVLADSNGKCGAAQVVHAMNLMCGFEESLGLFGAE